MLPILSYVFHPTWSIGPLVISIFAVFMVGVLITLFSFSKDLTAYSALVSALSGLICNAVIVARFIESPTVAFGIASPSSYVFYGIYISFAFVPGLIGFYRISKGNGSKIGKFTVYLGYLWALITIIIGLAMTVYITKNFKDGLYGQENLEHLIKQSKILLSFMYYSGWGFIAAYLVLISTNTGTFPTTSRISFTVYSLLNLLAVLVNTIVFGLQMTSNLESNAILTTFSVTIIFCDTAIAMALVIATYYGSLWNQNPKLRDGSETAEALDIFEGVTRIACFK